MDPAKLARVFARGLLQQEMSTERWIAVPEEIRKIYAIWRPTPLVRARGLEQALGTPARIYFKDESHSPPGSHKANTSVAQVYYNKIEGIHRLTTETGAGQWGAALSFACTMFGMKCKIFMVKVSYHQKPYRRMMMHIWGGDVTASPSMETQCGRAILEKDPDCPGSLGIAISEAVEAAVTEEGVRYTLGSVLNHVLLHQTVIGLEAEKQMQLAEDYPDIVMGCVGGGSNFAGLMFPFLRHKLTGRADMPGGGDTRFIACEPHSCPSMSRGQYRGENAHPGAQLHAAGHPRWRAALSRHGTHGQLDEGARADRGRGLSPGRVLRGGAAFRLDRRHHPRPGELARHSRRDRRGPALQGDRPGEVHPLQSQRSRPLRHGLLREVFRWPPGGLRLSAGENRGRPGRTAGNAVGNMLIFPMESTESIKKT
jgi:threonine dehydratase